MDNINTSIAGSVIVIIVMWIGAIFFINHIELSPTQWFITLTGLVIATIILSPGSWKVKVNSLDKIDDTVDKVMEK